MESCLHKSGLKDEKKASDSNGDEESCVDETVLQIGAGKRAQDDDHVMKPSSPNHMSLTSCKQGVAATKKERSSESESRSSSTTKRENLDNELGSTKAEMDKVMQENQRLKMYLDRILEDYRTLQTQYRNVIQQDQAKRSSHDHDHKHESDHELIDLSLGMSSSDKTKDEHHHRIKMPLTTNEGADNKQGLTLGLDCTFNVVPEKMLKPEDDQLASSINPSPENSLEESKEEGSETMWPAKTNMKNVRDNGGGEDEISQQNPAKRARVSVRVRCDTPTMNDGCQWRKYGQKIAKGNPCPRAYYRCTVAPSCPVRKQVQRCAEDMSILITTYEGTHNHPLPMSATAMASTTSAAASMLISGSSTSGPNPSTATTTASATLNGLNFYLSSSDNSRSKPYYLPNSSISSTPSFPTITLDLTNNSSISSSLSSSSSSHMSRLAHFPPRYSTTNLNFSSLESNPLPLSWSNGMLSYGSQINHKTNQMASSLSFGPHQPYDQNLYQSYLHKSTQPNPNPSHQSLPPNPNPSHQSLPPNTIAAITSDPSFQSALAAALSSIIGSGAATNNNNSSTLPNQMNMKNGEGFPVLSSFPSTSSNANKCAPSFMNKSPPSTSNSQTGDFAFLSTPFSSSKSKSNSPGDHNRDH